MSFLTSVSLAFFYYHSRPHSTTNQTQNLIGEIFRATMATDSSELVARTYPSRHLNPDAREIRILRLQPGEYGSEISCTLEIASLDQYGWNEYQLKPTRLQTSRPQNDSDFLIYSKLERATEDEYLQAVEQHHLHFRTCKSRGSYKEELWSSGREIVPGSLPDRPAFWAPGKVRLPFCGAEPCQCYEAMSYVWGPSNERRSITLCGEKGFAVTDNLYSALQRLRYPNGERKLWIDAICINQDDLEERAQQVSTMAEIFRKTWNMIAWLGDTSVTLLPETQARMLAPAGQLTPQEKDSCLAALSKLTPMACPRWWQRMWTFPELVAYGCDPGPEIALGSNRMSWGDFLWVIHGQGFSADLSSIYKLADDPSILESLESTTGRGCSDIRDYVFSLLGIIDSREAELITPNYSPDFTPSMAFADATSAIIRARGDLRALVYVDHASPRPLDLPSWAIDFASRRPFVERFGRLFRWRGNNAYSRDFTGRQVLPELLVTSSKECLCLRGALADRIMACASASLTDIVSDWEWWDGHHIPSIMMDMIRKAPAHDPYCNLLWLNRRESKQTQRECIKGCQDGRDPNGIVGRFSILNPLNLKGTCYFVTEAGFIGEGSECIQKGDSIALLYGSEYPAILRRACCREKNGEYYTFCGMALIPSGRVDDTIPHLEWPEMDFKIR